MFGHAVLFVFSSLGSFLILKCLADFRVCFFVCLFVLFCFVVFFLRGGLGAATVLL